MGKSRFTEEQILGVLAEYREGHIPIDILCRKYEISGATLYRWQAARTHAAHTSSSRIRTLEEENRKLTRLLAEALLTSAALCDMLEKPSGGDPGS